MSEGKLTNDLQPVDVNAAAGALADAAKLDPSDPKAAEAVFLAQQAMNDASFRNAQYQEQAAYVAQHNAPIEQAQREAEDRRTNDILKGAVAAVGTLAVVEAAANAPHLAMGGLAGIWGGLTTHKNGEPETEPTTVEMGPTAAFGGRATKVATVAALLGRQAPEETLSYGQPFVSPASAGPGVAATVADPAASDPAVNDPAPTVQRIRSTAYMLENNSLASGPKPNAEFLKKYGGNA